MTMMKIELGCSWLIKSIRWWPPVTFLYYPRCTVHCLQLPWYSYITSVAALLWHSDSTLLGSSSSNVHRALLSWGKSSEVWQQEWQQWQTNSTRSSSACSFQFPTLSLDYLLKLGFPGNTFLPKKEECHERIEWTSQYRWTEWNIFKRNCEPQIWPGTDVSSPGVSTSAIQLKNVSNAKEVVVLSLSISKQLSLSYQNSPEKSLQ